MLLDDLDSAPSYIVGVVALLKSAPHPCFPIICTCKSSVTGIHIRDIKTVSTVVYMNGISVDQMVSYALKRWPSNMPQFVKISR